MGLKMCTTMLSPEISFFLFDILLLENEIAFNSENSVIGDKKTFLFHFSNLYIVSFSVPLLLDKHLLIQF
jgi:hypothetical protein